MRVRAPLIFLQESDQRAAREMRTAVVVAPVAKTLVQGRAKNNLLKPNTMGFIAALSGDLKNIRSILSKNETLRKLLTSDTLFFQESSLYVNDFSGRRWVIFS